MKNENELIGSAEAAKLLGIERTTLYQWTSKKLVPFVRVSRNLIKFNRAELQSWIAERRIAAIGGHAEKSRPQEPIAEKKRSAQGAGGETSRRSAKEPSKDRQKRESVSRGVRRAKRAERSGSSKVKDIEYEQGFLRELGIRPEAAKGRPRSKRKS